MIQLVEAVEFSRWFEKLGDRRGRARITARLHRLAMGNPGDVKAVGNGISELRIDCGPGYRVYFIRQGDVVAVLLCGGDKGSQRRDITKARELAKAFRET
jgi:putative addiction module killer protein